MANDEKNHEKRGDRGGLPGDTRDGLLSANVMSSGASEDPVKVGRDMTPKDVVNQLREDREENSGVS